MPACSPWGAAAAAAAAASAPPSSSAASRPWALPLVDAPMPAEGRPARGRKGGRRGLHSLGLRCGVLQRGEGDGDGGRGWSGRLKAVSHGARVVVAAGAAGGGSRGGRRSTTISCWGQRSWLVRVRHQGGGVGWRGPVRSPSWLGYIRGGVVNALAAEGHIVAARRAERFFSERPRILGVGCVLHNKICPSPWTPRPAGRGFARRSSKEARRGQERRRRHREARNLEPLTASTATRLGKCACPPPPSANATCARTAHAHAGGSWTTAHHHGASSSSIRPGNTWSPISGFWVARRKAACRLSSAGPCVGRLFSV